MKTRRDRVDRPPEPDRLRIEFFEDEHERLSRARYFVTGAESVPHGTGFSSWAEAYARESGHAILYFSSARAVRSGHGATGFRRLRQRELGSPQLAPGLNTASEDSRPNVRKDGLEVVFDSTRPGGLSGLPDIWTALRSNDLASWSTPLHLDAPIHTTASESRASLSWDGLRLHPAGQRAQPGRRTISNDVYVTTRAG